MSSEGAQCWICMGTNDEDTLAPHLCKCVLHRTCAVKFLQDLKTRSCRLCGTEYPLKLMDFVLVPPPQRISNPQQISSLQRNPTEDDAMKVFAILFSCVLFYIVAKITHWV